jgi:hypothetical protein
VAYLRQLNGLGKRTKVPPGYGLLVPGKGTIITEAMSAAVDDDEPQVSSKRSSKLKTHGKKAGKRVLAAAKGGAKSSAKKSMKKGNRVSVSIRKSGKSTKKPANKKKARR